MPLIHSKKPSAFKENVREMVHSGHPVKQAVAAAYSEQRRAQHHKAHGGEIESCPHCNGGMMAEGGGVHEGQESGNFAGPGTSHAGQLIRGAHRDKDKPMQRDYNRMKISAAKNMHSEKLSELQSVPNPKLQGLAEGGEVQSDDDELHDMLGQEMMEGIHSKDYKKLMGGIEAMVLRCLNKKED